MKTIAEQLNIKEFPFKIKDKQGRKIYIERSTGTWDRFEYDGQGNVIYWENSSGQWIQKEYDENGKLIYHANDERVMFDSRPREIEEVEYTLDELEELIGQKIKIVNK